MQQRSARLSELAALVSKPFVGEDFEINGLGLCNRTSAYESILSYVASPSYAHYAQTNPRVVALFVNAACYEELKDEWMSFIVTDTPEEDFYALHEALYRQTDFYDKYDFDPVVGQNCSIAPTAVVERGVRIGNNVQVGAYSVVKRGSVVGDNCRIGCLTVIGSEGFQVLRRQDGTPYTVSHVGGTRLGCNVWVGDNTTICNAMLEGDLVVGDNCIVDNHCQVAHNCTLGQGNVLTAGVTLLGSAELKDHTWIAPGALVMNRVVVDDGALVGANATAHAHVKAGTTVVGTPAVEISEFAKMQYTLKKAIKKK